MKANNIVEMLERTVNNYPEKDALRWKEHGKYTGVSYQELWESIRDFASGLKRLGLNEEDKLALIGYSGFKWTVTDFSTASINVVNVPIYPTLPAEQVAYILNNADITSIVVQDEAQYEKVLASNYTQLNLIIIMDPSESFQSKEGVTTFDEVVELGRTYKLPTWQDDFKKINRDNLLTIIHTSGTTGNPKGAMLTHGNILANIEGAEFWLIELTHEDETLSYLPVSHVFERLAGHFLPLAKGATISYAESIETIADNLKEVRPTLLTSVPRLFEKVYAQIQEQISKGSSIKRKIFEWALKVGEERYDYYLKASTSDMINQNYLPKDLEKKWRRADKLVYKQIRENLGGRLNGMVSGGGTLNPEIAKFFWALNVPILEGYGLTETSPIITTNPHRKARIGTVGLVLPNIDVKIASDGEILVRGPSVTQGYYNAEEETKEAFVDGWFMTGDLGAFDEYGYLKILDRKKRILVTTTGMNVAPAPIESSMNESKFIAQSLVVGDNRKFITTLINPEYENLHAWAKHKGIRFKSNEELLKHPKVIEKYEKEVKQLTSHYQPYAIPKKIILIPEVWTVDSGELTPKLSLRNNIIEDKYKDLIEAAYQE